MTDSISKANVAVNRVTAAASSMALTLRLFLPVNSSLFSLFIAFVCS